MWSVLVDVPCELEKNLLLGEVVYRSQSYSVVDGGVEFNHVPTDFLPTGVCSFLLLT